MHKPFELKEGDDIELFNYKIRILKLNKTLPEIVELRFQDPEGETKKAD
jgi:hypothetical protein